MLPCAENLFADSRHARESFATRRLLCGDARILSCVEQHDAVLCVVLLALFDTTYDSESEFRLKELRRNPSRHPLLFPLSMVETLEVLLRRKSTHTTIHKPV